MDPDQVEACFSLLLQLIATVHFFISEIERIIFRGSFSVLFVVDLPTQSYLHFLEIRKRFLGHQWCPLSIVQVLLAIILSNQRN